MYKWVLSIGWLSNRSAKFISAVSQQIWQHHLGILAKVSTKINAVPTGQVLRLYIMRICTYTTLELSQKPIFHELDRITGNQTTVKVLEGSASKWERVAIRLYFDGNMISQIWSKSGSDQYSACQNTFSGWLAGKEGLRTPRTWDTVLKEADLGQLADDLNEVLRGKGQKYQQNINIFFILQMHIHLQVHHHVEQRVHRVLLIHLSKI